MAFDAVTKWLLVAESGINAVGIVDTEKNLVIAHLPVGWMPTGVSLVGDRVYVTNELGRGAGPKLRRPRIEFSEAPAVGHGTVSTFYHALRERTAHVYRHRVRKQRLSPPWENDPPKVQAAIKHVVLIVKEGRSFDELLGDVAAAGNGPVQAFPQLAYFGMHGLAIGAKNAVQHSGCGDDSGIIMRSRGSGRSAIIFYAEGYVGAAQRFCDHLKAANVTCRVFDNKDAASDQKRADEVIAALEEPLPQFVFIHLPNDKLADARPADGYPYEESWMEDNDLALGRIVEALSHSRGWPETAVFVTESTTETALDHIDSRRTILLAAGPHVKRDYVSHTNLNFSGLFW